ncbi:prolipoprotein diacylglyceryl transferase [Pleionea sediminis]|uniref:prolipoprotein diacylglyceryl transferase n=1 Tax=Pleionea sediminis TaxID=2569479 RepID=UPI001184C1E3|nr:prolipoprotein diacylglyceryl transferase family protein [Pleionea sediminis]
MDDLIVGTSKLWISPIYALSLLTAFVLVFLFPLTKDFQCPKEKHQYFYLQAITFIGAIFGAKLAVLMGDVLWPIKPFDQWFNLIFSGRSIVGALLFGFIFSEIAKPIMGYRRLPNDRFAVIIPFSIAIGRIGCWFSGCCLGIESKSFGAIKHLDGIERYPIALIEISFHLTIGAILIYLFRKKMFQGQIFALFMIAYGSFRFLSEFIRATDKAFLGYSAYQWFALILIITGILSFILRNKQKSLMTNEVNA